MDSALQSNEILPFLGGLCSGLIPVVVAHLTNRAKRQTDRETLEQNQLRLEREENRALREEMRKLWGSLNEANLRLISFEDKFRMVVDHLRLMEKYIDSVDGKNAMRELSDHLIGELDRQNLEVGSK